MTVLLKNGQYSYDIEKGFLGEGSFGKVYKGVIVKTNQVIAIKGMSLALINKYGPDLKEIIKNQVGVLKELSKKMCEKSCPFIIRIYDCILTEHNIYLMLEFCGEGDLNKILDKRKRIPEAEAVQIIYHIVRALDYLAINNVCHRDLKPENIFITRNTALNMLIYKVGDFGFAVNSVKNQQQVGTYPYMSPELLKGEAYGSEVDVWALGVIAHQILFGVSYFIGKNEAEVKHNVLNKQYIIKEEKLISKEMVDFLHSCLKKDRKQRIPVQKLRKHPVFRQMQQKYGELEKGSVVLQRKSSNEQQDICWKIQNQINKSLFLQELARNLYTLNRVNCLSIYLIKSCLSRLFYLNKNLRERNVMFNATAAAWTNVTSSEWYASKLLTYCQHLLNQCKNLYESELLVFQHSIKSFDQPTQKQMVFNLGLQLQEPPNQKGLAQDLFGFSVNLAGQSDNKSKLLAGECLLAIKIDNLKFDFGKHLKERGGIDGIKFLKEIPALTAS